MCCLVCRVQVFEELRGHMFGNPHSANPSSSMTGDKVEEVRPAAALEGWWQCSELAIVVVCGFKRLEVVAAACWASCCVPLTNKMQHMGQNDVYYLPVAAC